MIFSLLVACTAVEPGTRVRRPAFDESAALAFEGIQSATWDGGDGLAASWAEATGEEVTYQLQISQNGTVLRSLETTGLELQATGLADGEYDLRVIASAGRAPPQGGGRTLTLYIGENRLLFRSNDYFEDGADIWGEGDIVVATARHEASLLVYDISGPTNPVQLARIEDMGFTKDVKIGDGLLFVQGECGCAGEPAEYLAYDKVGIRIFDFADPSNPTLLSEISIEPKSVHNLAYGNHTLFASDNDSNGIRVFDVSDPSSPVQLDEWLPPRGAVHDQAWIDGLLYVAALRGFAILDASDPANIEEVLWKGDLTFAHNIWPSEDGNYVFVSHETMAGALTVWDVSDLSEVTKVATYDPHEWTSVHNVHIRGDIAYLSYYHAGLELLDVSNPLQPTRIGWFDTWSFTDHPNADTGGHEHSEDLYSGNWGVWPYGDHIAAVDTGHGLFVFDYASVTVTAD